jgi:hypothetical protein
MPIGEAVRRLNARGMEVVAGIIMGLDADGPETPQRIIDFIEHTQIPMLTINLLQALPKSPLWDRLARENRLTSAETLESNVVFARPHDEVVADWRKCLAYAYDPARLFARYDHQTRVTYPHRLPRVFAPGAVKAKDVRRGLTILFKVIWKMGVLADYRRIFWRFAWPRLKAGKIEEVISVSILAKHLITFARKACAGELNASNYSMRLRARATGRKTLLLGIARKLRASA